MGERLHWVLTQRTFTKRVNLQLNGAHITNDVEKDLDDGIVLIALFEALRKQKVNFKHNKTPKMWVAGLENTNRALKFLIMDGVKLVIVDAENIVEGDLNTTFFSGR